MNKALKNTKRTNNLITVFLLVLLVIAFCGCGMPAKDQEPLAVKEPVTEFDNGFFGLLKNKKLYVTSVGQASDSATLAYYVIPFGVDFEYDNLIHAEDVEAGSVVFLVVGCSSKSMGANKVTLESEIGRSNAFLQRAENGEITLVAWHIGGDARRGALSDIIAENVFSRANYVCFTANGNADLMLSTWADHEGALQCQLDGKPSIDGMLRFMVGGAK